MEGFVDVEDGSLAVSVSFEKLVWSQRAFRISYREVLFPHNLLSLKNSENLYHVLEVSVGNI